MVRAFFNRSLTRILFGSLSLASLSAAAVQFNCTALDIPATDALPLILQLNKDHLDYRWRSADGEREGTASLNDGEDLTHSLAESYLRTVQTRFVTRGAELGASDNGTCFILDKILLQGKPGRLQVFTAHINEDETGPLFLWSKQMTFICR